jgi:predicted chitinase
MKLVFPITTASGGEFANQNEIEAALKQETVGQFGFNRSNLSWHGGLHLTEKNAPWVKDKYPVRAIADGKVVACRISKHYQETTYKDLTLSFSNDFCLIEHEFLSKDDSGHDKKFVFYSLYMHLAPIPDSQPNGQTPRKLHKLKKRRNARELPGLNGPKSYLKTGSQLELIESEPEIEIDAYTFRRYTMVDNAGNNDNLAKVGTKLWIADNNGLFEMVDEVIPNYPTPQWLYKKYKGKITSIGLSVRSDPTGNQAGSAIGKVAKDSEFEFVVNSGYKSYDADGHQHIMALCTFKSGATKSDNVTPIRQGWIAVDQGLVEITDREPLPLDTLNSLGSNSFIRVKAGDPIGYLGQFDVLAPDSEAGLDTRYQVHFEVFAKDKPTDEFVKTIFAKDDLAKVSYISDLDSNGFCDPDNPREFFVKLANNTQEACDSETQEMTPEQIVNGLSAWDANKFTIVQHESEWYDKAESKSIFDLLLQMYKEHDIDLPAKLEHEKERVNKLIWMQDESKIGFGKHVWSWWPVLNTSKQVNVTIQMLKQIFDDINNNSKDNFLQAIANDINENADIYKLNTELRISHFFAQVREEAGSRCRVEESFDYSPDGLKSTFKYFRHHPDEADLYGRTSSHSANPEAIANRAYNGESGNRGLGNGNISSGDGWKYRGRGLKQLTGRNNYSSFTNSYSSIFIDEDINFIINPGILLEAKYAIRSAVYFWLSNNLYNIADEGVNQTSSNKITEIINQYTDSYDARFNHLNKIWNNHVFKSAF